MSTETHEAQQNAAPDEDVLHGRADDFVAGMDRTERVVWLKDRGFTDQQILDALLDPEDGDLDEFCRDAAHQVAADVANGSLTGTPEWLA